MAVREEYIQKKRAYFEQRENIIEQNKERAMKGLQQLPVPSEKYEIEMSYVFKIRAELNALKNAFYRSYDDTRNDVYKGFNKDKYTAGMR